MAPEKLSHRRTHNLLLISKLLGLRDSTSPLTLLLDSLEQPAIPLLKEYIRRSKLSKTHVTLISSEAVRRPNGVDSFISANKKSLNDVAKEVVASYPAPNSSQAPKAPPKRCLVIIDSVHPLISRKGPDGAVNLPEYLSGLLGPVSAQLHVSLLMVYHQDMPEPSSGLPYAPSPLSLLTYLATSIITVHSFAHILDRKEAADRSMVPPVFGLDEEREGVIIGNQERKKKLGKDDGTVLEMEHRRKSGRGVVEWYFLPCASNYSPQLATEVVILLDDHPLYRRQEEPDLSDKAEKPESTFELGLTERQRREREGVVLPYFDAQKGAGPGEGGRILYDMGEEDDFDEEEDEI